MSSDTRRSTTTWSPTEAYLGNRLFTISGSGTAGGGGQCIAAQNKKLHLQICTIKSGQHIEQAFKEG
ncbi:hypothetical protein ANANG_G00204590 [Anguilla anguilla]|uniref:Uncharacterized protein n=1 Tax=Anguilla anguilla TaxID=7936 RepID=A0A9D3LYL1_ANGAN|nr:hypothetical protein ANANG_G00204590 [Anguilla anguilla]